MNGQEFTIEEATIREIQQAFADNKLTSRQLVDFYLNRIGELNPVLRGVVEVNPDARDLADEADPERQSNGGSLGDKMNTTAGSYALIRSEVARDAGVVERLRKAGTVILGKASLSEWYRIRSINGVPNGWCARSGQGVVPSGSPCRSSSGSAISVAANMVAVSLGTETHSSIVCPSDHNSVVGLKPTIGLTSQAGVIPCAPRWDTIGPICRSVEDAVYVLDVIAGFDPRDDEATREGFKFIPEGGYKQFLKIEGLKGKRLGVVRSPFVDKLHDSAIAASFEDHLSTLRPICRTVSDAVHVLDAIVGFDPRDFEATREAAKFIPAGGYKQFLNKDGLKGKRLGVVRNPFLALLNRSTAVATFEHHLYTLRQSGATIVDNLEITNVDVILDPHQSGEAVVMLAEFKLAINDYLKELITSPVRSLSDVITFNMNNADLEKTEEYGQEIFYAAEFTNGLGEEERMAIEAIENLSRDGIEKLMKENKLDAMVTPGSGASPVLAIGWYSAISVPAGYDIWDLFRRLEGHRTEAD